MQCSLSFFCSASGCPLANRVKLRHESVSSVMTNDDQDERNLKNEGPNCPTPGLSG